MCIRDRPRIVPVGKALCVLIGPYSSSCAVGPWRCGPAGSDRSWSALSVQTEASEQVKGCGVLVERIHVQARRAPLEDLLGEVARCRGSRAVLRGVIGRPFQPGDQAGREGHPGAVSYTHLTLP